MTKYTKNIIQDLWPAIAVLLATLSIAVVFGSFAFLNGIESVWKVFVRFFRHSANLVIPVMLLPLIFSGVSLFFNRGNRRLVIVREDFGPSLNRLHYWLIRPFQGIGIVMLFATKLIAFLNLYSSMPVDSSLVFPQIGFNLMKFAASTSIGVFAALLLASLWGLDEMDIRCHNARTGEIRKLGKNLGIILPVIFGFYGIMELLKDNPPLIAIYYVTQMVIVLYPPFVAFSIFHSWYIRKYRLMLINRLRAIPLNIDCLKDSGHKG